MAERLRSVRRADFAGALSVQRGGAIEGAGWRPGHPRGNRFGDHTTGNPADRAQINLSHYACSSCHGGVSMGPLLFLLGLLLRPVCFAVGVPSSAIALVHNTACGIERSEERRVG